MIGKLKECWLKCIRITKNMNPNHPNGKHVIEKDGNGSEIEFKYKGWSHYSKNVRQKVVWRFKKIPNTNQ